MEEAANYYNGISSRWPGVRFYVFAIPSKQEVFAETGAWLATPTRLLRGTKDFDQFGALLSKDVAYGWFGKARPAGQILDLYYNTDHHLITTGGYEAYRQLYHLISSRKVGIGEVVQCKNCFIVPNVIFRGSYSRLSGGYEGISDKLINCSFELPDYTVTIHGAKHRERRNKRLAYDTGNIPKGRFVNHPAEYFGADLGLIEYVVDKVSEERNLLIIGDSNDNFIEPLLAAHFLRSYFVDLRHFTKEIGQKFDLDIFISQNSITDVLFIGWEITIIENPAKAQDVQEEVD